LEKIKDAAESIRTGALDASTLEAPQTSFRFFLQDREVRSVETETVTRHRTKHTADPQPVSGVTLKQESLASHHFQPLGLQTGKLLVWAAINAG
jgi:hypothetical protein